MEPFAHASIGLMVKPFAPKAPLWALAAATALPDVLSFGFMAAGIEYGATTQLDWSHGLTYQSPPFIPWSHGLAMSIVWSAAVAALAWLLIKDRRASLLIGLMPLGHWLLDFIVYLQMPIFFDQSQVTGLGLITSRPGLILGLLMEIGLIVGGIAVYWVTRPRAVARATR